jgi:hypothetical protein
MGINRKVYDELTLVYATNIFANYVSTGPANEATTPTAGCKAVP